jgi:hypothetical protein
MHGGRFEEFYFQNGLIYFIGVLDAGNFLPNTKRTRFAMFFVSNQKICVWRKKEQRSSY